MTGDIALFQRWYLFKRCEKKWKPRPTGSWYLLGVLSAVLFTQEIPLPIPPSQQSPRVFWSVPRHGALESSGIHSGQTTGHVRYLSTSGRLPVTFSFHQAVSSHKISTVNLRHSSHLGTKSSHSASTNVLLPSFTAQATGFSIRKSVPREAYDNSYCDKSTSLHVWLRTRKFDKKIHYCCKDSFFVEKDI